MVRTGLRRLLSWFGWRLLSLRYRIEIRGLDEVRRKGTRGVLFLPNHVALVDPAILMVLLDRGFQPRALADAYQVSRPIVGWLARLYGARVLPNMEREGLSVIDATRHALDATIAGLRDGECLLFYPSGRLRARYLEEIRAASGTEILVKAVPGCRVVLVRQSGLWGSSFSLAFNGRMPDPVTTAARGLKYLLLNGLFFMPRRRVLIDFVEPADFPRQADRMAINQFLETFYNAGAPPNTYVPYGFWERGGAKELPDPEVRRIAGDVAGIPEGTRRIVLEQLTRLTGRVSLSPGDRLAQDLGLDSLAAAELVIWLEREFGFSGGTPESLVTVGDVILAAGGRGISVLEPELRPASRRWLSQGSGERVRPAPGDTVTDVFLAQASRHPGQLILADQLSGEVSFRRLVLGLLLLVPRIRALPGPYVGIMLPASVGAGLFYLAVLFAGKTPVMVNWTTGSRNISHALDLLGVDRVITARALLTKLEALGVDLGGLGRRFVYAEDLRAGLTGVQKGLALVRAYVDWSPLRRATPPAHAVVLFTSGSETFPKAVPLSHANVLTNIRDVLAAVHVDRRDVMVGMLPPFHSFGIAVTTILPICSGLRTVYHPNPTEAAVLARLIAAYRVSMLVGTPTFLHGIVRAARPEQLSSLRLAVTGAEKCPDVVYQALRERCRAATILEGYGITECSPIVSVNRPEAPVPGSIGLLMESLHHALVDLERPVRVRRGDTGMLLVRGPSVFSGYLHYEGESPFVEFEGQTWYRTGDLVHEDAGGVLVFDGRLKRFVKLGGEMVSLPAIEAVLLPHFTREGDEGPALAVEAVGPTDNPEIALFTVRDATREGVNRILRDAGFSALCNIRQVIRVERIPVLGTGKTDYRGLSAQYASGPKPE